ncbi:MAG: NifU family protein [Oligoflexia bacterium]|nr:NifU family protein [Oligoflexia bacterium]
MELSSKDILVRVMETPNPLAVKLVVNFLIKSEGKASFTKKEEIEQLPLFSHLFNIPGVHQIHVFENQISLSHQGITSFEEIEKQATDIIKKWGPKHSPNFTQPEEEKKKKDYSQLSETHRKVEEILNRTVRPGLQADGGDLEVVSVQDNKIEIAYQGACGGCPSSYMDTLFSIENILRYEMKNDKIEVYPI